MTKYDDKGTITEFAPDRIRIVQHKPKMTCLEMFLTSHSELGGRDEWLAKIASDDLPYFEKVWAEKLKTKYRLL